MDPGLYRARGPGGDPAHGVLRPQSVRWWLTGRFAASQAERQLGCWSYLIAASQELFAGGGAFLREGRLGMAGRVRCCGVRWSCGCRQAG